ncbi:hypothetical protein F2Q69_00009085 [Brassica cretica]|uniref:Uncharacterized protein n=1 Tax=Brassica cretica TaxID=69181 RepID=A0A8S9NZT8_BRACR|nr:hypothetical protein F2Q69_00009085 [Brassica cretica]
MIYGLLGSRKPGEMLMSVLCLNNRIYSNILMNHGGGCEEDERERGKTKVDLETSKKEDLGLKEERET